MFSIIILVLLYFCINWVIITKVSFLLVILLPISFIPPFITIVSFLPRDLNSIYNLQLNIFILTYVP